MSRKNWLFAATGLVAAVACSPALALEAAADQAVQTKKADAADANAQADQASTVKEVIVRGIRGSAQDSANKKRKAKQISDSVSAEDAGKLPDNSVTEALAHVTGVQITRSHGEGGDIAIRGMQAVGTTINGNSASGGELRSMNHNAEDGGTPDAEVGAPSGSLGPTLSDIPAELIKSVTVYKTRTADQIEGGIAGTVNVELRRPLDMPKGLTVAGSLREVFSNIGNTQSPYGSLLVADRFDTPVGEMGVLLNLGYAKNNYEEMHIINESPMNFYGGTLSGTNDVTFYRAWDGVQKGSITRPSLNAGYQWRVNQDLDFVVEGSYFGSHELSENDYIELRTAGDGNPTVSNLVLQPDGKAVKSMTLSNPSFYIDSQHNNVTSKLYTTNFEVHWKHERLELKGSVQHSWSDFRSYYFYQQDELAHLDSASVDFDSASVAGGGAAIKLNGSDLSDPSNYRLFDFHDGLDTAATRETDGQIDATYNVSETWLLRSVQAGFRLTNRDTDRSDGYRDGFPNNYAGIAFSDFPSGGSLARSSLSVPGFASPVWYHISDSALNSNLTGVRAFLVNNNGHTRYDWSTPEPGDADKTNSYRDHEGSAAFYGQINYGFDAFFPVDGIIGARAVTTWGGSDSTQVTFDKQYNPTYTNIVGAGRYTDVMPNLSGTVHFTPKLQLRLAYTYNVERPAFSQLSPWIVADQNASVAYSGNPDLKPNKITNYDASLEYYFHKDGVVSLAAYLKKPSASFFYSSQPEYVAQLGKTVPVYTTRNAGPGTFQGYEFNAQSFFFFLPGWLKNFGADFNATYNQIFKIDYPVGADGASYNGPGNASYTSKYTYNAQLFYDTPTLSARLAYNYRSKYRSDPYLQMPEYTEYTDPTSRLDAAINWTPQKHVTFSLEGSNLLKNSQKAYWGYNWFPAELRLQASTVQLGVRFRY